jgi:hypothetical protein
MNRPIVASFLACLLSLSLCEALEAPLVGCSAVDCPSVEGDSTAGDCRVGSNTLSTIGLASYNTSLSPSNLTWTIGIEVYDNLDLEDDHTRNIEKSFYLGTPPTLDLTSDSLPYTGCALFFTDIYDSISFPDDKEVGTCGDAMGDGCASALLGQAKQLMSGVSNQSEADACQRLQDEFRNNLVEQCSDRVDSDGWEGLYVQRKWMIAPTSYAGVSSGLFS